MDSTYFVLAEIGALFWPLALVAGLVLIWLATTYNSLVAARNRMRHAFSGIDVQLRKRHDLIPNLVNTVRATMTHERQVLEQVTALRTTAQHQRVSDAGRMNTERAIGSCLGTIIARAEAYPELRATENLGLLMRTLNEIEEQISASRRSYNAAVERLNNRIESFPSNLIAGRFEFVPSHYFEAVESSRVNPDVGAIMHSTDQPSR